MPVGKCCALLFTSLAAIGVANADDSDVTLWIGWFVVYSEPILPSEKEHNIRHENWMAESLSRSEAQCKASFRGYRKPEGNVEYICKAVGLSKADFDRDSHFAVCSHLQSSDMALHWNGTYEPLGSWCDDFGIDREWTSRARSV